MDEGTSVRKLLVSLALCGALLSLSFEAKASILTAEINISQQVMTVSREGRLLYTWPVSTARDGYWTPRGKFRPTRMHRMWHSRKYDMSPMPFSVFFHHGYAIHGTSSVKALGRPASHGCVRLKTGNAAKFFALVKEYGAVNTRIVLTD